MRSRSRSKDRRFVRDSRVAEYSELSREKPSNRDFHARGAPADRDNRYRDIRDRDRERERDRERYASNSRRSVSRSRSRDRGSHRGRDYGRSGKLEVREVKRILSGNDQRSDRRDTARPSTDKDCDSVVETRKKSYDEFVASDRLKTDDDVKVKRSRVGDYTGDKENHDEVDKDKKKDTTNSDINQENNAPDDTYDDKALEEIEKFLSTATTEKAKDKTDKIADTDSDAGEVVVLWEDEEEKKKREEMEAEERRKKRLEITKKYAAASVPTSPVGAKISALHSPKSLTRQRAHTVPETPSAKSDVPIRDISSVMSEGNTGGSSICVPATIHLAKLDLGNEDSCIETPTNAALNHEPLVGNAVSAAVRAVLPPLQTAGDDDDQSPSAQAAVVVAEADAEGRQLEAEKSALELEERKEQRGATKGYGGGYGAGGRVEFDMFSASPSGIEQVSRTGYLGVDGKYADTGVGGRRALREALLDGEGGAEDPHLQSNWDDGEGYYKARIGELVGDRFQILGVVGKGVFSTVLKCIDLRAGDGTGNVAVKMIRNNDTMRKAAEKEKAILLSIAEHDRDNKKYCVRLLTHLEYRNHVALVFEYQTMNLRETLKKFGKDVGINIGAVRMYGRQLFVALKHLMDLRIVHADIKLDNILCSADLKQVKLCDFGSAFLETDTDNDPTPYLVSRFYRAPEIILGQQYDRAIDLWSVCASLYELFTGHVMFPGRTNNEMLKLMMAVKGRFPNKLIKSHMRSYEVLALEPHFDPDLRFRQYEADPITGKTILRLIDITHPTRDLAAVLRSSKAGADDMKLVTAFTDMLEKGLTLDPAKRMTVVEAFRHPFLSSK